MSKKDEQCCQLVDSVSTKLDSISKKVAENLSGKAIQERVNREAKIFSENRFCKWNQGE